MTDLDLTAFYGQFRDETWENLDLIEQGLTDLEARPDDRALLDRMLRAIHTTKGSAKIMGFGEINRLAHRIEDLLGAIRKEELALTPQIGDLLFEAIGAVRALTEARIAGEPPTADLADLLGRLGRLIGAEAPAPQPTAPPVTVQGRPAPQPRETIRVNLERVDRLTRQVGELLSLQQRARAETAQIADLLLAQEEAERALRTLQERLEQVWNRLLPAQREEVSQCLTWSVASLRRAQEAGQELRRTHSVLREQYALALNELHQDALSIRMLPIGTLFEIFPAVVRRMAGDSGVEVALEVQGSDVELDRRVLDLLRDPLIHLVRNALDHGIEPPAEREKQGKPRRGHVVLEAEQRGRRVYIRVRDDGRGIDLERVRRRAMEQGRGGAVIAGREALLQLIFEPGFSTREQVTDISGRGVGLNVVQTAIRQLGGTIQIDTQPGQGTTFTLDVPLTLATIRALLVETAGEMIAFPALAVRGLLRIRAKDLVQVEGRTLLRWQEQAIPLLLLDGILGLRAETTPRSTRPAVITGNNGRQVALAVDRVLDEAEIVVQPLEGVLSKSPYFSAATTIGRGRVVPVLNPAGLLTGRHPATVTTPTTTVAPTPLRRSLRILLVEDALITRELERSILEAAGYQVETALDGVDALQRLEKGPVHLIVTDIEMPRMDGFELTTRLRQDPRWADLPVVIVTAREDEQSRRRGLQVGAQAYIVKSRFDQSDLLETIARLVG